MESVNPIDLLRALYQLNPNLSNTRAVLILEIFFTERPDHLYLTEKDVRRRMNALSTQKARLRKEGLNIPDLRKRRKDE